MKRKFNKRSVALLVTLAVILVATVGVTLAFIITGTGPLANIFNPAKVQSAINETINGTVATGQVNNVNNNVTVKENVSITNTGNTDAYIRVAVVITWKDSAGNVYGQLPVAGTDYSLTYAADTGWMQIDGFYYYTEAVAPGAATGILIDECQQKRTLTGEDGEIYTLSVEIVASAIQADPETVVEQQWGVAVTDGVITGKGSAQ